MATPHSYTRRAHDMAVAHVHLVEQVVEDGEVDEREIPLLIGSALALSRYTNAAHCTAAVSQAVNRVTSARTLADLTRMAQAAIDELPESAA